MKRFRNMTKNELIREASEMGINLTNNETMKNLQKQIKNEQAKEDNKNRTDKFGRFEEKMQQEDEIIEEQQAWDNAQNQFNEEAQALYNADNTQYRNELEANYLNIRQVQSYVGGIDKRLTKELRRIIPKGSTRALKAKQTSDGRKTRTKNINKMIITNEQKAELQKVLAKSDKELETVYKKMNKLKRNKKAKKQQKSRGEQKQEEEEEEEKRNGEFVPQEVQDIRKRTKARALLNKKSVQDWGIKEIDNLVEIIYDTSQKKTKIENNDIRMYRDRMEEIIDDYMSLYDRDLNILTRRALAKRLIEYGAYPSTMSSDTEIKQFRERWMKELRIKTKPLVKIPIEGLSLETMTSTLNPSAAEFKPDQSAGSKKKKKSTTTKKKKVAPKKKKVAPKKKATKKKKSTTTKKKKAPKKKATKKKVQKGGFFESLFSIFF